MTDRLFTVVYHERTNIPDPRQPQARSLGYVITQAVVSERSTNTSKRDGAYDVAYVFETALRYVGDDSTPDVQRRELLDLPREAIGNVEAYAQRIAIVRHDKLVEVMAEKWGSES